MLQSITRDLFDFVPSHHRNFISTSDPHVVSLFGGDLFRAGRCRPGIVFRLFSRVRYDGMPEFQDPEILRYPLQVGLTKYSAR